MDYISKLLSNLGWQATIFSIHDLKTRVGMFKNMGGNIPGANLLGGNFSGGNFPRGSLTGGNFPGGSFADTVWKSSSSRNSEKSPLNRICMQTYSRQFTALLKTNSLQNLLKVLWKLDKIFRKWSLMELLFSMLLSRPAHCRV